MENKTEVKAFLKDLQKELNTQETDGQAGPRFWVIMDYREEVTAEGFHDNVRLYDNHACHTFDSVDDYIEDIEERIEDEDFHEDDLEEIRECINTIKSSTYVTDFDIEDLFASVGDEDNMRIVYTKQESYIVPNTFFLTKKEAKEYLERYGYNHTNKAHTYAMTAIRSPKMSALTKILETCNWDDFN